MALPLLGLGLLAHVLLDVKKVPAAERLCATTPCVLEFPRESPGSSVIVGSWLSGSSGSPAAVIGAEARLRGTGHPEERDCTLLVRATPQGDSRASLLHADPGGRGSAFPRAHTEPSLADLTPKPERYVPDTLVVRERGTVTCTIEGTCEGTREASLPGDGPAGSSDAPALHFTPRPGARGSPRRCRRMNLAWDNPARSGEVEVQVVSPARLLSSSCTVEKTLRCRCAFHGIPTPSVRWWLGGAPAGDSSLPATSSALGPWVNSTVHLDGEPEVLTAIHCEGKNPYGTHTSRVFLLAGRHPDVFLRGLLQGVVYGALAAALLCFCLVLLARKMLQPWKENEAVETRETGTPMKPGVLGRPLGPRGV